jgi:phosphoribosyl 1,2-cyclic phosphodiesterase
MSCYVKFWGTRGSIPTPGNKTKRFGGNTPCIEMRFGNELFICDAGSGLRELGADMIDRGIAAISAHLFISHTHWDHIQGFPFFTPAYGAGNQFYIYGMNAADEHFFKLLSGQMVSDYFPVRFADLQSNIISRHLDDGAGEIAGVEVATLPLEHPGGCIGYSFVRDGVKIVYATDNEIDRLLPDAPRQREADDALRAIPQNLIDFARDADLLIADGQYTEEEYYPKRVGWGHASCLTTIDFAILAKAKQLALFHHDPNHSDADVDQLVETCRQRVKRLGSDLIVFAAREGLEFKY